MRTILDMNFVLPVFAGWARSPVMATLWRRLTRASEKIEFIARRDPPTIPSTSSWSRYTLICLRRYFSCGFSSVRALLASRQRFLRLLGGEHDRACSAHCVHGNARVGQRAVGGRNSNPALFELGLGELHITRLLDQRLKILVHCFHRPKNRQLLPAGSPD